VTLIEELRGSWPPADRGLSADYVHGSPQGTELLDAWELPPLADRRLAVAIAAGPGARLALAPLAANGTGWRRARAGDGVAVALVGAIETPALPGSRFWLRRLGPPVELDIWDAMPADVREPSRSVRAIPSERAIQADQTNESLIVGETVMVKWISEPRLGPHPAPVLLAHLAEVGFTEIPAPYATLEWSGQDGRTAVCALVDAYLPEAADGWTWCVDLLRDHLHHLPDGCAPRCDADIGTVLGALVARLHLALATPSSVLPRPVSRAGSSLIARWHETARGTLAEALSRTDGGDRDRLLAWRPRLEAELDSMGTVTGTPVQPVHGDLHVGQVLRWRDGHAVIDFDGNPTLPRDDEPATDAVQPQPTARDVAQMLMSIDHVGRVVDRRIAHAGTAEVERWIARNRALFLGAYRDTLDAAGQLGLLDERLLPAFEVEQECRELVYAARFLPRWRYAPMTALEALMR